MRSFSSFTPHYAEDVTMSISQLLAEGKESQSALSVLQALALSPVLALALALALALTPTPTPTPNTNTNTNTNPHCAAGAAPRRVGEHHRACRPRGEPHGKLPPPRGHAARPWRHQGGRLRRTRAAECGGAPLPRPALEPCGPRGHERHAAAREPRRRPTQRSANERSY